MMTRIPRFPFKIYILDDGKRPVEVDDIVTWGRFLQECKHIAFTELDGCHVSTVFIGINHRHFGKGPPLLFETMIFGGPLDQSQWRYASYDDAITGHSAAVTKVRARVTHD